jgi:hypothetical protein
VVIKSTYRIPPKGKATTNADISDPLVVKFDYTFSRNEMLQAGKELKDIPEHKKVYFRPDRSPDEQAESGKLYQDKDHRQPKSPPIRPRRFGKSGQKWSI